MISPESQVLTDAPLKEYEYGWNNWHDAQRFALGGGGPSSISSLLQGKNESEDEGALHPRTALAGLETIKFHTVVFDRRGCKGTYSPVSIVLLSPEGAGHRRSPVSRETARAFLHLAIPLCIIAPTT